MNFDVAAVGSGLVGLTVTLYLVDYRRVAIISKRSLSGDASDWAQGGIAAALDSGDSHDKHVDGTLIVGARLCDEAIIRYIIENGRSAIEWLTGHGIPFTRDEQARLDFHLTREDGHRHRRIIHAADATGHAMVVTLAERVRNHPNIVLLEDHFVIDLITGAELGRSGMRCHGLCTLDTASGHVKTITAGQTVTTMGGAGKIYLHTTNPDTASGDGIVMVWRTGCRVTNAELIQLHPTCLYHPFVKSFLITEAMHGEGGKLTLPDGMHFIPAHDERAELAPRDIAARTIDFEVKKRDLDCVYLDISHQSSTFLKEHFPTIMARCLELGTDITRQPIPVVPVAHYTCGGAVTDYLGRTDIAGLYAVGETAHTDLHSVNRLVSNSLLECMMIGRSATEDILAQPPSGPTSAQIPIWGESHVTDPDEEVVVSHNQGELRRMMWNCVGTVRANRRLGRAQHRITLSREEITEYYANFRVSHDLPELCNLAEAASLIVDSTLSRHESRDLHFSRDYPETLPKVLPTVMWPTHRQIARKR